MRHDHNGSVGVTKKQEEEDLVEVPIVLMQRGRAAKETTARMSYGLARQMMEGSGG